MTDFEQALRAFIEKSARRPDKNKTTTKKQRAAEHTFAQEYHEYFALALCNKNVEPNTMQAMAQLGRVNEMAAFSAKSESESKNAKDLPVVIMQQAKIILHSF